jgi:regulatory protein
MDETVFQKILNFSNFLLSRSILSTAKLREKLTKKFPENSEEINTVCEELNRVGILNDAKFAENFARNRGGRGAQQIIFELRKKGIAENLAREVLREMNFSETEQLRAAATRKLKSLQNFPVEKQREKLTRFLLSRGFSFDEIRKFFQKN